MTGKGTGRPDRPGGATRRGTQVPFFAREAFFDRCPVRRLPGCASRIATMTPAVLAVGTDPWGDFGQAAHAAWRTDLGRPGHGAAEDASAHPVDTGLVLLQFAE